MVNFEYRENQKNTVNPMNMESWNNAENQNNTVNVKNTNIDFSFIYNPKKSLLTYMGATAFSIIFFLIYNIFSHGVLSNFMTFLFIWPLVLGALPSFLLMVIKTKNPTYYYGHIPSASCLNLYRSGVAILTMSSLLQGVFEIAGTGSKFQLAMWPVGAFFLVSGLIAFFIKE